MRSRDVRVVSCNLRGWAVGEDNAKARHLPDALVEQVCALRVTGLTFTAIESLTGAEPKTAARWCRGERRTAKPVRFIVRRVVNPQTSDPGSDEHRDERQQP